MSTTNSTAAAVPDPDRWNETRAPQALVVVTLCPAIALVVLMMRLYTRAFLLKRVFWEDYIVSVAMVCADCVLKDDPRWAKLEPFAYLVI